MKINNKNLYIDIGKIVQIFQNKNIEEVSQEDWEYLKLFKEKITSSSSFAHKFCKMSNELESNKHIGKI